MANLSTMASPVSHEYSYNVTHTHQYSQSPPAPPPSDDSGCRPAKKHRRGYQACEPCRARKVACRMGPDVDNPTGRKCLRCIREMKECVFAPQRKKAQRSPSDDSSGGTPTDVRQATPRRGIKRKQSDVAFDDTYESHTKRHPPDRVPSVYPDSGSSPMISNSPFAVPQMPAQASLQSDNAPRSAPQSFPNNAKSGYSTPRVSSRIDAMKPGDDMVHSQVAAHAMANPVTTTQHTIATLLHAVNTAVSADGSNRITSPEARSKHDRTYSSTTMGAHTDIDSTIRDSQPDKEIDQAVEVWAKMRFVKAGWISAQEAMNYIEFFYRDLAPITPVKLPDFRSPRKHYALLTEEPVLALTILTVTSRQMPLQGQASISRSHEVHRQFWQALQGMVQRLLWGQEQFGGGFCGAGAAPLRESVTGQISWTGSLRTLGTIDALLLLTDWQPRALHFPPDKSENDLIDRSSTGYETGSAIKDDERHSGAKFSAAAALEPGWRSDRMSWMLLGLAQSMAFELGVFDNNHDDCGYKHGPDSDCLRKRRLRRLVVIYLTQTGGRLGIKCVLSPDMDADPIFDNDQRRHSDEVDMMQFCWLKLAAIMYSANQDIFSSKQRTKDLTAGNKYKDEIAKLAPRLADWRKTFERVSNQFHPTMRHVLLMEYEYARMFINSVGFNKVVESWKEHGPKIEAPMLAQIAVDNRQYIDEVRSASTSIVQNVIAGFADKNQLKNAAIRTYLRSFAGMVFTLKLFSLGNSEKVIKDYLRLLDKIVAAMESQVVDDVHISTTIAVQVKTFTNIVKNTMIRIRKPGNGSGPPSREASRQQSPKPETIYQSNPTLQDARYLAQLQAPSPDDPLASIQARPMADFSDKTYMLPPGFNMDGNEAVSYDSNIDPTMTDFDLEHTDWLTLPLDNILEGGIGSVEPGMSGVGPLIGNRDMLEWLDPTNDNMVPQWNGMTGQNQMNGGFGGINGF